MFKIEVQEESTRYRRLCGDQKRRHPPSAQKQVVEWWKERGDWREKPKETSRVTFWKWRHESPSPEPEDLTLLAPPTDMEDVEGRRPIDLYRERYLSKNSTNELLQTMNFTPSETDALETIDLPTVHQPKKLWTSWPDDPPPHFPGQLLDLQGGRSPPIIGCRGSSPPSIWLFGKPQSPPPLEEQRFQGISNTQSQEPRRPGQRLSRGGIGRDRDRDRDMASPRRSARIAAIKRPAKPLPLNEAPGKRPRMRTTSEAAAPPVVPPAARKTRSTGTRAASAHAPPETGTGTGTRARRGRGCPEMEKGGGKPAAVRTGAGLAKPKTGRRRRR